jgi:hypothetical protein
MCSGVVPQQPPAMLTKPASANSRSSAEVSEGSSSRQLFGVGAHQGGAQRAIEADGERPGVAYRIPEGRHGLARQDAARGVGDGPGDHQRQARGVRVFVEILVDREQRGLAVEGVEDGLDQQQVDTAIDQAAHLLIIAGDQLVEGDVARGRVVHFRRNRRGLGRRAEGAGDKARLVRRAVLVARGARQFGRLHVHLVDQVRHVVVVLGDAGRAEGIGFDQVGAGGQVTLVDFLDHLRLGQRQQLVVSLDEEFARTRAGRGREVDKTAIRAAAVRLFVELVLLDDRAHRAVQDHDPARQDLAQLGFNRGDGGRGGSHRSTFRRRGPRGHKRKRGT